MGNGAHRHYVHIYITEEAQSSSLIKKTIPMLIYFLPMDIGGNIFQI